MSFTFDKLAKKSTFFADSSVNKILEREENKFLAVVKNENSKTFYDNFNNEFSTFLSKLPNNNVKKYVLEVFNKGIIYLAVAKSKPENTFAKIELNADNSKLRRIILSAQQLGVDPIEGISSQIDECVYASYFTILRAAILVNRLLIKQDKNLHKLISTYLYILFLKIIGPDKIYSEKQKAYIHILSIYIFYRHYLKEKHDLTISIIKRDYNTYIKSEYLDDFLPILSEIKSFDAIKDFPKILIDAKILKEHPNIFIISLLKLLGPMGIYCLFGPLDYLIGLIILSRYPVNFISKGALINEKIQNTIEEIVIEYIDKIHFDLS